MLALIITLGVLAYTFGGVLSFYGMVALDLDGQYDNTPGIFASMVWPITWAIILFSFLAKYIVRKIEEKIIEIMKGRK